MRSFTNAGRVITQGVDIGAAFAVTPTPRLEGSITFFDFTVRDVHVGDNLPASTPR